MKKEIERSLKDWEIAENGPEVRIAELEDYLERINDIMWRVYTVNNGIISVHEKEIMEILEEWAQNEVKP